MNTFSDCSTPLRGNLQIDGARRETGDRRDALGMKGLLTGIGRGEAGIDATGPIRLDACICASTDYPDRLSDKKKEMKDGK